MNYFVKLALKNTRVLRNAVAVNKTPDPGTLPSCPLSVHWTAWDSDIIQLFGLTLREGVLSLFFTLAHSVCNEPLTWRFQIVKMCKLNFGKFSTFAKIGSYYQSKVSGGLCLPPPPVSCSFSHLSLLPFSVLLPSLFSSFPFIPYYFFLSFCSFNSLTSYWKCSEYVELVP